MVVGRDLITSSVRAHDCYVLLLSFFLFGLVLYGWCSETGALHCILDLVVGVDSLGGARRDTSF